MRKRVLYNITVFLVSMILGITGCIKNDIPYPIIPVEIFSIEAVGQIEVAIIDANKREVIIPLSDTINLKKVEIVDVEITKGGKIDIAFDSVIDLSSSYKLNLSMYQDYVWTLKAQQEIEYKMNVDGQIGSSSFKSQTHEVVVNVGEGIDLDSIVVMDIKLGPTGSTINGSSVIPKIEWDVYKGFAMAEVSVNFKDFIVNEKWTIFVFTSDENVVTESADPGVNVAWLKANAEAGADNGFEIKKASATEWEKVSSEYIKYNEGAFTATVPDLEANTDYVCRAYSNGEYGKEISFTTGVVFPLPNSSYDDWHKVDDKIWNPWLLNTEIPFWDTGNKGSSTLGDSNTYPIEEGRTGKAACLESKFVGVFGIGKFAAGNLFVGEFIRVDGTDGVLNFGKPFTERPTSLTGYYKYDSKIIDKKDVKDAVYGHLIGKPDSCIIYVAIGDWSEPIEIRTKKSERKLFDINDPNILAYGEFKSGTSVSEFTSFEIPLVYRNTSRKPRYIMIVCSASKYGDFYIGGRGSKLIIDDFELEYNY